MKKTLTIFALFFFSLTGNSQTKRELTDRIETYYKSVIYNKPFDAEKAKVFEAMNLLGQTKYHKVVRESESRGFCSYSFEDEFTQEVLTMEIMSAEKPYRVYFSVERKTRTKDYIANKYSDWSNSNYLSERVIYKFQFFIYKTLFELPELPEDLQQAIEDFNSKQSKDKKKIIKGIDY